MKLFSLLIALLATTATITAQAQKLRVDKIPPVVRDSFQKSYPQAQEVEWEVEDNGEFEVEFEQNDEEISVVYNALGAVLEVETEIAVADLPAAVQMALKGKKIKEADKIVRGDRTYYEVEVRSKDLMFDANGKAVSTIED